MMSINRTIYSTLLLAGFLGWIAIMPCQAQSSNNTAKNLFELTPQAEPVTDQTVQVSQTGLIDLDLRDQDITQVLNLLSLQSQRNIIASPNVTGTISGRVYGADLYEVLDGILASRGLSYRESGNFIHVYTTEELKASDEANRKLVTKIVRLNYISAQEANNFVSPLLSENGKISVSAKTEQGFEADVGNGGANSYSYAETLIIRDNQSNVEEILAVLAELDKRPEQVLIESTILKVTLTEDNTFGVDITAVGEMAIQEFTNPISVINNIISNNILGNANISGSVTAIQTQLGASAATGGTRVGIVRNGIAAFIQALDQITDTTIVARPKLLVLNRQRAIVQDTSDLAQLVKTKDANTGEVTFTFESVEVGTILSVRPFVSQDDFIRLELKPELSTGRPREIDGLTAIDKFKQNMITNVLVRNGNTVVLGGLIQEETTVDRRQTPVLGDIPLLGAAFRNQADKTTRTETIFLITPTIVRDDSLYANGEQMKDNIRDAQMGARQGLLPFSRTKIVSDHVRQAQKSRDAGDMSRALMFVEMALRLDPNFPQARQLRQEILGQKRSSEPASFLNDLSDQLIRKDMEAQERVVEIKPAVQTPATQIVPASNGQTASVPVGNN